MRNVELGVVLSVRIPCALDEALRAEAGRMRLRLPDLVRYKLAEAVAAGAGDVLEAQPTPAGIDADLRKIDAPGVYHD